jgi:branched-chain amino acid transport system permease protein
MTKGISIVSPDKVAADRYAGLSTDAWRWLGTAVLIGLVVLLPFRLSNYHVFELTMVMIYAIAVLGLNILTGYNGQISLGHGGFFAVGAYTAAILMHHYAVPYWATLPVAALICFVLGVLFGLPALRFEGPYLALVTLAMAVATPQVLKYFDNWTGGQQGLNLVKPQPPPALGLDRDRWLYFIALIVLLVAIRVAVNMLHGRTGRAFVAIRDHPIAAAGHGDRHRPLTRRSLLAPARCSPASPARFPQSSSALSRRKASPLFLSISFLVGSAIGGIATISGAIVGGIFIQFVPNLAMTFPTLRPRRSTGWRCCCSCKPCRTASSVR